MFLSIAAKGEFAPDLGYVLYKHPDRIFARTTQKGHLLGFFPRNDMDRAEFCLVIKIDPVARVRGASWEAGIAAYVEPAPYLAASHMSHAISEALRSAMNGNLASADEAIDARLKEIGPKPWSLEITVGPVRTSPHLIQDLFGDLGWNVSVASYDVDVPGSSEGRPLHVFTLKGEATVSDALSQLYVLLPVLDPKRHYFYGEAEARKLLEKGGNWLRSHSRKDIIISRYLSKSRELREYARKLLGDFDEKLDDEEMDVLIERASVEIESEGSPHDLRHRRIVEDVQAWGARHVADLGCGEGRLMERLVVLAPDMRVVGVEPSARELERARKRLSKNPGKSLDSRADFILGSAAYVIDELKGVEVAVLSEVVEHLEEDRLEHLVRSLFGTMRPARVIVTTPNRDYNEFFGMLPHEFRHGDHRFEWSAAECRAWATDVAESYGYDVVVDGAGGRDANADTRFGDISHYVVFTRKEV